MKLSEQAVTALMMALQKSLMEQSDVTETFKNFEFANTEIGLVIKNPPLVKFDYTYEQADENDADSIVFNEEE